MFLSPHQIHERYLRSLKKQVNSRKRKMNFVIQGISDKSELERIKRVLITNLNIKQNDFSVSSKNNFKKVTSSRNMIRQATGRQMDLKEYSLSFIIQPEELINEEEQNTDSTPSCDM